MSAAASGSRRRLAAALGVNERDAGKEYLNRLGQPQAFVGQRDAALTPDEEGQAE